MDHIYRRLHKADPMQIPLSEAKAQLAALVRRAEAGEDVVLTRHGRAAVKLTPVRPVITPEARLARIRAIQARAAEKLTPGPSAARSQDFLYDENGLPG